MTSAVIPQCIGYAAGALTTGCVVPQIYRAYRTRSTADISYWFLLSLSSGLVLWLTYGILIEQIPVIIPNAVSLGLNLGLLTLKTWYDVTGYAGRPRVEDAPLPTKDSSSPIAIIESDEKTSTYDIPESKHNTKIQNTVVNVISN